ncbi:MAG: hypothetical protein AAB319_08225, partial [Pseudomonadota bacterium]
MPGRLIKELGMTAMFAVLIAGFLTLLTTHGFLSNLIYALSISLSIHLLSILLCLMRGVTRTDLKTAL